MQELHSKHRFEVLDVFRGLFAFVVVLYHLKSITCSFLVQNTFTENGYLFVDFFFVLSGFVIAYSYESKITDFNALKDFLYKRFFRLYPLHLAILLVYLIYVIVRLYVGPHLKAENLDSFTTGTFLTNLFLVNSIKFPGINKLSWNYPSWSISAEVIAYLAFGLIALAINKLNIKRLKVVIWAILVMLVMYWAHFLFHTLISFTTFNDGFLRGLIGFFVGIICQITFQKLSKRINKSVSILFGSIEIVCLALIVFFVIEANFYSKYGFIYEALFFCTIIIFAFEKGFVSNGLKKVSLLKNIGKHSYSIYMIHSVVILFANLALKKYINKHNLTDTIIDVCVIIAVYFLSAWTYRNIEVKFYNKKQKAKIHNMGVS